MNFDDVVRKLEARTGRSLKRSGTGYSGYCPAHDDKSPSLSVAEGQDGKILLHCHAGCAIESICDAIGVKISDLFPQVVVENKVPNEKTEYFYTSEAGDFLYKKVREVGKQFYILSWTKEDGWSKGLQGARRVLYRLPEVVASKERGERIFVVEGEKDAERLRLEGLVATTPIEGAGSSLKLEYIEQLTGTDVVILYDEDRAGWRRRDQWIELLVGKAASVRVVELPGLDFQEKSGADVSDWLDQGHTVNELQALVDETEIYEWMSKEKRLVAVTIDEFLHLEIPSREMILSPVIPAQGLTMLYSKRGVGKTLLALAMGYAVATGTNIMRWHCDRPAKVLYVDGEMPAKLMQERLDKLEKGMSIQLSDPSYFRIITPDLQPDGLPDIANAKGQELLEASIGDAQLLILDNLSTLTPSLQENEGDAWAPLQSWLLKLRRRGLSVLMVHHAGKSGQQRGTSRREDVLDAVIVLKQSEGQSAAQGASFKINFEKSRSFCGIEAEPFIATLVGTPLGGCYWVEDDEPDDLYDLIVAGVKEGITYRQLAEMHKVTKSKVEALVKRARGRGDLSQNN